MLNKQQIDEVVKWMNEWGALRNSLFPSQFKKDFLLKALEATKEQDADIKNIQIYDYRKQLWISAVSAVAGAFNCEKSSDAVRWADNILIEFDKRFPNEKI